MSTLKTISAAIVAAEKNNQTVYNLLFETLREPHAPLEATATKPLGSPRNAGSLSADQAGSEASLAPKDTAALLAAFGDYCQRLFDELKVELELARLKPSTISAWLTNFNKIKIILTNVNGYKIISVDKLDEDIEEITGGNYGIKSVQEALSEIAERTQATAAIKKKPRGLATSLADDDDLADEEEGISMLVDYVTKAELPTKHIVSSPKSEINALRVNEFVNNLADLDLLKSLAEMIARKIEALSVPAKQALKGRIKTSVQPRA